MSFLRRPSDPHSVPSIFPTYLLPSVPLRRKSRHSSTDSTSSTDTTVSSSSTLSSSTSSNPFTRSQTPVPISSSSSVIIPPEDKFLTGHSSHIHCAKCATDLCLTSQIISKGFTGRHGRAFLVQGTPSHIHTTVGHLPNTYQNKAVPRNLVTGQHTVSDISCAICGSVLGWKYVEAKEEGQKYKVGKYILETKRIRVGVSWEGDEDASGEGAFKDVMPLPPDQLRSLSDGHSRSRGVSPSSGGGGGGVGRGGGVGMGTEDVGFDSQNEDECEDLFAGVWSPQLAMKRRQRRKERVNRKIMADKEKYGYRSSTDTLA